MALRDHDSGAEVAIDALSAMANFKVWVPNQRMAVVPLLSFSGFGKQAEARRLDFCAVRPQFSLRRRVSLRLTAPGAGLRDFRHAPSGAPRHEKASPHLSFGIRSIFTLFSGTVNGNNLRETAGLVQV